MKKKTAVLIGILLLTFLLSGCLSEGLEDALSQAARPESSAVPAAPETTAAQAPESASESAAPVSSEPVVIRFAGDFTQAEEGGDGVLMPIMETFDGTYGGDIEEVFSDDLLEKMRSADIFMLNNEFTYSDRGRPTPGKDWTFRADPSRVSNLVKMGVDIVGLANNHAWDWGEEAFLDTIRTLDGAGILHVGAGENLAAAKEPAYIDVKGLTFSFVCATSVEMEWEEEYGLTQAADETRPGVLRTTDPADTIEAIRTAKVNSDFCFVFVHWGIESTTDLTDEQVELAHTYIDAGADAVIGSHPHILQGFEFYSGKPILYSLGNFWFNTKERETALLELSVDPQTRGVTTRFLPCVQKNCRTVLVTKEERRQSMIAEMNALSRHAVIGEDGRVTPSY